MNNTQALNKSKKAGLMIILVLILIISPLKAQDPGTIQTLEQTGKTFAAIAERTANAVVGIQTERQVSSQQYLSVPEGPFGDLFDKDFFDEFFRRQSPDGQAPSRRQTAQGSGFIVSGDGYILTNNHLVSNAESVAVKLVDGREFKGKIVGSDPDSEVAVVKIDASNLKNLQLADSDKIEVGEWVLAVGNPFGFTHSVTAGIISAKGRSGVGVAAYENFIQTDAAINPGNSGGPLLNLQGQVVGINTAIISRTGGNLGIGLAIPSNMAKYVYDQIRQGGKVIRGYLGVITQDLSADLAQIFNVTDSKGVLIPDVVEGSAADKGGIEEGDIILELNGKPLESSEQLRNTVAMLKPGTEVEIVLIRNGERLTRTVELGTRPTEDQPPQQEPEDVVEPEKQIGLQVQNLTRALAQQLGFEDASGVLITAVRSNSLAASAGLKTGMLIMQVNRKPVENIKEFTDAVKQARKKGSALLLVNTGNYNRYVVLNFPKQ